MSELSKILEKSRPETLKNKKELTELFLARLNDFCQTLMSDYLRYQRDPGAFYRVRTSVEELSDIIADLKGINPEWDW